ncbi:MAG: PD-(D/E)XK nuclease domain-containing protein [Candidatus Symbiothrix sp.]|jgi:hypothetical protein|nr:PD-(D/E)XK nuclease domain-containing protein [Candidatus Symbiothrix sp.]
MSRLLSSKLLAHSYNDLTDLLLISLINNDFEQLKSTLNALLASIPYDDYSKALQQKVIIQGYKFPVQEWLYRSTIFAFMRGCGLVVQAEMHTNKGRADLVLNYKGKIFVIELKVAYEGEDVKAKAEEAYAQIFEKNYNVPYPNAICIGLVINDKERQITEYRA